VDLAEARVLGSVASKICRYGFRFLFCSFAVSGAFIVFSRGRPDSH